MNDSEILDWLQSHVTQFRETIGPSDGLFEMDWIVEGNGRVTTGANLRDCVRRAAVLSYTRQTK